MPKPDLRELLAQMVGLLASNDIAAVGLSLNIIVQNDKGELERASLTTAKDKGVGQLVTLIQREAIDLHMQQGMPLYASVGAAKEAVTLAASAIVAAHNTESRRPQTPAIEA